MEGGAAYVLAHLALFFLMHGVKGDFCESTWFPYEDMCFKFFDESIVQSETSEHCSSRGAHLLSALTPKLRDFLVTHMEEHGNFSYWCVTQTGEIDSRLLHSNTTTTLSPAAMITSPETVSTMMKKEKPCYYLRDKKLNEGKCNVLRGFVCEKDAASLPSTCPEGTEKIGSRCFWISPDLVSKPEADESCSKQGGRLASLQTTRIRIYATGNVVTKRKNVWVGASREEEKIKWDSGDILDTEQQKIRITIKDAGGNCVILGLSGASKSQTSWIFKDCNTKAYGLCEKEATVVTTPTVTTTTVATTTPAPKCPGSNKYDREKNGICYWVTTYETPLFDWDKARKFCQGYGGDLASYKDAEEEDFSLRRARRVPAGHWIGLRRESGSSAFRWSDGSTLTYTNWAPGEPKLTGNVKLCVMHTGKDFKWKVSYCGINRWFVCKIPRDKIPSNPVLPTKAPVPDCRIDIGASWLTWMYYQGSCYAFYTGQRLTREGAKMFCQDNGAFLASVHSIDEINFLLENSYTNGREMDCWIGLRTKGILSAYRWDDGTPFDFVNWEDDHSYDERSSTRTCVSFDMSSGTWKEKHCNYLAFPICKVKNGTQHTFPTPVPTAGLEGYCPDGWYTFGNKCYKLFGERQKDRINWTEANKRCTEMGSQLVSIHSKEEQDFLTLLVWSVQSDTWIGMYSTIAGRLFHWTDNSSMVYMNWGGYQPDLSAEEKECVHMKFTTFPYDVGTWRDIKCSMTFSFICQNAKDPMQTKAGQDPFVCSEPKGWIKLGSSCYQIFNGSENHLSWLNAQKFCMNLNSNLATIGNSAVSAYLSHHLKDSTGLFWIGMRDGEKNTYRWFGNSADVSYTNWLWHEPAETNRLHNCVAMNVNGYWAVRDCDESHPFICEESTGYPTLAPPEPDMVCPDRNKVWKDLGGKFCYIFEIEKRVSWHEAAASCFSKGGCLASIHSEDEAEALRSQVKNSRKPVYIGLAQTGDGNFVWLDGSAVDYVNWQPGEPNSKKSPLMCVEMYTHESTWNDISCSEARGYICSTRKVPRNVSITAILVDDGKSHGGGLKTGPTAGIIIGVIVVLVASGAAIYYFRFSASSRAKRQVHSTL